eukprot:1148090-Pelagomonas_calceolata.AAC.4
MRVKRRVVDEECNLAILLRESQQGMLSLECVHELGHVFGLPHCRLPCVIFCPGCPALVCQYTRNVKKEIVEAKTSPKWPCFPERSWFSTTTGSWYMIHLISRDIHLPNKPILWNFTLWHPAARM